MSVNDYLSELCKEDNINVNDYLSKHNDTRTLVEESKNWDNILGLVQHNSLLNHSMDYTWRDRIKAVWMVLKNLKYSSYNPFDFKTYRECGYWRNDGYYPEKSSTPWQRFRRFIIHQKSEIKWAWNYTPEHIKHYNKNEGRISTFEELQDKIFSNDIGGKSEEILKNLGYIIKPNHIYYDQNPKDEKF